MSLFPFIHYGKYIVRFHLVEKLFSYYLFKGCTCNLFIDFQSLTIHYSGKGVLYTSKLRQLVVYLFYAFFLEKVSCVHVSPCFVHKSIANFKVLAGQLLGFSVRLNRIKYLYNFVCQYLLYNVLSDKGFTGVVFNHRCFNSNYGFVNFVVSNLYSFPAVATYFESINEFIPNCQVTFSINLVLSTKNILGIMLFFSHWQVPLRADTYYNIFSV